MKVKVTPPYEGAGSFEAEVSNKIDGHYITNKGDWFLKAHCTEISEITPEPGDICEFWSELTGRYIARFVEKDDSLYVSDKHEFWQYCRVLARKPKGWPEARDDAWDFRNEITDVPIDKEKAAYERFLSAILGGAEYGRVEG